MRAIRGFSTLRTVYVFEIFFQNEKLKNLTSPSDEHFDFTESIQQIVLELNMYFLYFLGIVSLLLIITKLKQTLTNI